MESTEVIETVDQLIDQLFRTKSEAAQDLAASQNALDVTSERGLACELVASSGISKDHWHLIFDTIACGVILNKL
jgi:hypothetical protein